MAGPRGLRARVDTTVGAIAGITLVGFALRLAVLLRPIGVIDKLFIPDDTYYTLTIARSLAHGHGPTVDGHTLTSGFQALLGFLMVPVFWVTDSPDTALRLDLALLVVADTLTILVLAWVAYRFAGRVAAVAAAALWAISPVAVSMALGGLETSLAVLLAVSLVAVWMWADDRPTTRRWIAVGVVAALAVLARIDIALLVALLAGVQLWRGPRRPLVWGAVAGAVVVAPWWIWCTVEFGTPIPTSGAAAHEIAPLRPFAREGLAQVAGAVAGGPFDVWRSLRQRLNDHPVVGMVVFWTLVIGLLFVAVWWARRRALPQLAVATLPAFAAGLLAVLRVVRGRVVLHAVPRAGRVRRRVDDRGGCRARVARAGTMAVSRLRGDGGGARDRRGRRVARRLAPAHRDPGYGVGVRQRHRVPRRRAARLPRSPRRVTRSARGRAVRSATTPMTASPW